MTEFDIIMLGYDNIWYGFDYLDKDRHDCDKIILNFGNMILIVLY